MKIWDFAISRFFISCEIYQNLTYIKKCRLSYKEFIFYSPIPEGNSNSKLIKKAHLYERNERIRFIGEFRRGGEGGDLGWEISNGESFLTQTGIKSINDPGRWTPDAARAQIYRLWNPSFIGKAVGINSENSPQKLSYVLRTSSGAFFRHCYAFLSWI